MISVRNRRPPLSGNKWLLPAVIAILVCACSPKIQPPKPVEKPAEKPVTKPAEVAKPTVHTTSISLLLPFDLDKLDAGHNYTPGGLHQADISLEYYQGFKLALDSLTAQGYNYRLRVVDTKGQAAITHSLAYNADVRASDLIVGPVFPDDVKTFTSVLVGPRKPIVSPLSPASPSAYKNVNLVTAETPLEYHSWAAAQYINDHYRNAGKVIILRSGYSDENAYILPFRKAIDSLGRHKIKVVELTVKRGQLAPLLPQLSASGQNVFVVPATDQPFLMVTLRSLDTLARRFPVTVFGHPNWAKFNFLKPELLQRLKTHITTSDYIDYKSGDVITFIKAYRRAYHAEPSSYAFKAFDQGIYFGSVLGKDGDGWKKFDQNNGDGLHNGFHFIKKPGLGWINTHVDMLQYVNFELKKAE